MFDDLRYDENGWSCALLEPLPPERAYTVFAPGPSSQIDLAALSHELDRLAGARARLRVDKRYPNGAAPIADAAELEVSGDQLAVTNVLLLTFPRARAGALLGHAVDAARRMGGGGMDALLPRATRVWQVATSAGTGDLDVAPILVAAALAQRGLGPVLVPSLDRLVGPASLRSLVARAARRE